MLLHTAQTLLLLPTYLQALVLQTLLLPRKVYKVSRKSEVKLLSLAITQFEALPYFQIILSE